MFVDFGLAVGVEDVGQTRVGGMTIQFAAPEQHYGESANQASDVFSLCAVMHYAVDYDNPDLRKPNRFTAKVAPESLRDALTRGMVGNLDERLQNAVQLLELFSPSWADVEADFQSYQQSRKRGNGIKEWLKQHSARVSRWQEGAERQRPEAMILLARYYFYCDRFPNPKCSS